MNNTTPRLRVAFVPMRNAFLGIARSIIYNTIFKQSCNGVLVLRIDDTDHQKSNIDYTKILEELRSLGLDWDEGPDIGGKHAPYVQSRRGNIYLEHVQQLLHRGLAYRCYCHNVGEECHCFDNLVNIAKTDSDESFCVKFRLQKKTDSIQDLIRGDIQIDTSVLKDPIILRSDKTPTFHIATVVDDAKFHITHVLRGADHIIGAFIQKQIYEAFHYPVPSFAHFSIFTGIDKAALQVGSYELSLSYLLNSGYTHDAIITFLAQSGYSGAFRCENSKIICDSFSFSSFSKNNLAFDMSHLDALSKKSIQNMTDEAFLEWAFEKPNDVLAKANPKLVLSQKNRVKNRQELADNIQSLYDTSQDYATKTKALFEKELSTTDVGTILNIVIAHLSKVASWETLNIKQALKVDAMTQKQVYPIIRILLTGNRPFGDLNELIFWLGKEKTIQKLDLFR